MSTLVHAALSIRRTTRASLGLVAAFGLGVLDVLGVFRVAPSELGLEHALVATVWALVFGVRVAQRLRARHAEESTGSGRLLDLELGALLLVAVHAGVQLGGGLTGPFYPLVYVVVALLASFARKPIGTVLVVVAVVFEAVLYLVGEGHTDVRPLALHALFVISFGLLNLVFTRVEIARVRERSNRELAEEKARVHEDARLYRLVGAATDSAARDEERVFRASLDEVHEALYFTLELLKRTLDLHTCVLFFVNEKSDGAPETMRIVELVSDSDDLAEGPFGAGEGAVGAVAKRGLVMNLEHLKPGYKGLCYYRGPAQVRSFLGVPVLENGVLRGALCADRRDERPFDAREEEILKGAVHQVLRAVQNERVFVQLERSKREQTVLHRASQALGAALSSEAVLDAGLAAAAEIAPFDFAAVTLYDGVQRTHSVRRAVGEGAAALEKLTFRDNTSLTAMAVKNKHFLPYRGDFDPTQHVVYTKKANLTGMESLLILPLVVREDAIGTLCLAARRREAFGGAVRPTLQVLANQLAVSLANAESVRRLEELATTDGLTGCLNKRTFLDELDRRIKAAERFGRRLSLVVTDIDHFKAVNDTYGHATGDVVIKELGAILKRVKRETDLVARFGGEEFCVLCEETEIEGAVQLAERVREVLGEKVFQTELGKLRVTASLGVATFPQHARTAAELFDLTDKALYAAKHAGRNRVCTVKDL
jgi:two-component system cell cycle response regulator